MAPPSQNHAGPAQDPWPPPGTWGGWGGLGRSRGGVKVGGPGPDRLGFGLGGQVAWAGPAWFWLGGPRVLGRTGLVLAWGAKGPGPGRLGSGLGGARVVGGGGGLGAWESYLQSGKATYCQACSQQSHTLQPTTAYFAPNRSIDMHPKGTDFAPTRHRFAPKSSRIHAPNFRQC